MTKNIPAESHLIDEGLKNELKKMLENLNEDVTVKAVLDFSTEKGKELAGFLSVIASLSDHIDLEVYGQDEKGADEMKRNFLPAAGLYKDGKYSGIAFCGVPGGQEINSFVLALYNLAGPGQKVSRWTRKKIEKLEGEYNIKICVSLACHHCPKAVAVCQQMAVFNKGIEAEMIDANLFPELVEKYNIERVPMIIINDEITMTGVKTLEEMTEIIKKQVK